ncbi:MAG: sucrase ferredoxin [Actinomycetota bacterium]
MKAERLRCADAADTRREPIFATASFVRRWLLVEQPGSWGRDALTQSRFPERVAQELRQRARRAGVRVVLIRRGVRFSSEKRQCYFVRTGERDVYQSHLALDRVDELLDVDLSPMREGGSVVGADERAAPVFLVCTHGRHDACCSIRGNQVSRIACAQPGFDAWECSHIGGDRFAANLVCFPHGIYYGRVGSHDVPTLMQSYARGTLALEHYRGRCCYPFPVQAAEYFARRAAGSVGVDDLSLVDAAPTPTGLVAAFSVGPGGRADVEVRVTDRGDFRLTCDATRTHPIPRYDLVSCVLTPG